jgi:hypothetical protein
MTGANHAGCRVAPQYNPRAIEKQYQWTGSMAMMANVLNSVAIDRDDRDPSSSCTGLV